MALIAGMILTFSGFVLYKQKKSILKKVGIINMIIGIATIIVDIYFLINFFNNGILGMGTHQLWEVLGIISGIVLLVNGIIILNNTNKNSIKAFGWINILIGFLNIIVDGFFFFSWFILDKIELVLDKGSNFLNMSLIDTTYIYLDNWSFFHLLWGMILMFIVIKYMKDSSYLTKSFIVFILLGIYEVWEFIAIQEGILIMIRPLYTFESYMNIFWDMKVGMFGGNLVFLSFKKNREAFRRWLRKVFN